MISLIAFAAWSCSPSGMKVVTQEKESAEVSDYHTYNWVFDEAMIPEEKMIVAPDGILVYNNMSDRKKVKDAIELQMKATGFEKDILNPEMLVDFSILENDTELRKYVLNNGQDYLGFGPRSETTQMVPVEEGTVIINFLDAETGRQIWQGFASGTLEKDDLKSLNTINNKVGAIFEDFNFDQFGTNVQ
ncbi:DUF4136 domain-containing protein [Algoriphagus sp.]|uniref:DUF4136 domain-containing protein n=1 Tax=Algoriphagus sp. TaxID=1872435 RepID=UPI0025E6BE4D|nr:DUF4136 domain-containing protein [Algoriphagus sp.]